jgi:DNA gyrase subunit A
MMMVQDEVVGMICIKDDSDTVMVVSEQGYAKRSLVDDYRITNRGGKGVKTINITEKTGELVTIKSVTDESDLMIINKSGIVIRVHVADFRIMGRATQGVRLINLEKRGDEIGSVCKVNLRRRMPSMIYLTKIKTRTYKILQKIRMIVLKTQVKINKTY